jgi:hypothetical protein
MKPWFPVCALLLAVPLAAHDDPVTHGVLTVAKGKVSIRLRLPLHHLQPELEAFAGRRLALKDDAVFEPALLEAFLRERLVLTDAAGRPKPWRVAQQDMDAFDAVLTLEAPLPSAKGARLRHTLFFERSRQQHNLVTVEGLGPRRGLTFTAKAPNLRLDGTK